MNSEQFTNKNDILLHISKLLLYIFFFSLIISTTLAQGIAGLLSLILLVRLIISRGKCYVYTPLDIPFLAFIIFRFVSTFLYNEPVIAAKIAFQRVLLYSIYFVITNTVENRVVHREFLRYTFLMVFSCVLGSMHAFYEAVVHEVVRPGSFSGGYSRLAEFSAITLILSSFLSNHRTVFYNKIIFVLAYLVILLVLLITQSRAAWAGTFIALLLLAFKGRFKFIAMYIVIFLLTFFFLPSVQERAKTILNPLHHTSGRIDIWKDAMEKVLDKPFWGYGVGSMKIIADPEVKKYGSWHSDYLQIVMESGFVTLFAYIILSFLLFRNCWRLIKKTEGEQKDVVMGIAASLVCMYFISFFGGHIVEPVLSLVFFSFISIVSIFSIKIIR